MIHIPKSTVSHSYQCLTGERAAKNKKESIKNTGNAVPTVYLKHIIPSIFTPGIQNFRGAIPNDKKKRFEIFSWT